MTLTIDISGYLDTVGTITLAVAADDASDASKERADYVCDGTEDDVQIQAAIDALPSGGGLVTLSEGTFNIATSIELASYTQLKGCGWSTQLKAVASLDSDIITLGTVDVEMTILEDFMINGNKDNQSSGKCVYYDNTNASFTYQDSHHLIRNIFAYKAKEHGFHFNGDTEGTRLFACKAYNCDGNSFRTENNVAATHFIQCISGGAGLQGFYILGAEHRFVSCTSFWSGAINPSSGDGYSFGGKSSVFLNCRAEDNLNIGFIGSGTNHSFIGCTTNDNGQTTTRKPGFYLDGERFTLSGCYAYCDKSGEDRTQNYGFSIGPNANNIRLEVTTYNNYSGDVTIHGSASNVTDESVNWT